MTTTRTVRAQVHEQAAEHVLGLHTGSDRQLTAWAAGVLTLGHTLSLTADPRRLAAEHVHSGFLGGGYDWEATSKGVELNRLSKGHTMLIRWPEIAALVAPVLQQPWYTRRRAELAQLRRNLTDNPTPGQARRTRDLTGAAQSERLRRWFDCEDRCYELAAEAWQACRPGEQTSLFDL